MDKVALFLSPHFDDEVLMGGGTIQVLKERGWKVIDWAITMSEESGVPERSTWVISQMHIFQQIILGISNTIYS